MRMVKKYTFNQKSKKKKTSITAVLPKSIVAIAHILRFLLMNGYESYKLARLTVVYSLSSLFNQYEFLQVDFETFIYLFFQELLLVQLKQRLLPLQLQG